MLLNPGPASYNPRDYTDQKNDRYYHLSQHKNPMTRRFGTSKRSTIDAARENTPGPGQYRQPSDFGYLDQLLFQVAPLTPHMKQSPRKKTVQMAMNEANGYLTKSRQI